MSFENLGLPIDGGKDKVRSCAECHTATQPQRVVLVWCLFIVWSLDLATSISDSTSDGGVVMIHFAIGER